MSVGERLKQARQNANLSVSYIAQKINISPKYLEAIEAGNYRLLPGEVYAKNFLKAYLHFFQLDAEEFLSQFTSEQKIYTNTTQGKDFKQPVARVSRLNLLVGPKLLRGVAVALVAGIVLVYLGLTFQGIVASPKLEIIQPADNVQITDSFIQIVGVTDPENIVTINGQQILIDQQGKFNELIDLQNGVNIIEVMAERKHGKQTKLYRQVVVDAGN